MKILHTADWHIGKKLHKHDLYEDFDLFIKWLCTLVKEKEVSLLLVSGDVFDLANPSSEARHQYYRTLMQLRDLDCTLIITGGNHDSPDMLNAPREILKALNVHVLGGLPQHLSDCIIPVHDSSDSVQLVVAALPYLRDSDLRKTSQGSSYEDRLEVIRIGIKTTFENAAALAEQKYPGVPKIALGHLYAAGIEISGSERDIQIGNQAAFGASQFGTAFKYIALGHIHKPQKVSAQVPVYYSGSPLPLSFSERNDPKRVLLIDTSISWEPESIAVPNFRKLLKISGNLLEIEQKINALTTHEGLDTLMEIELKEDQYDAAKIVALDQMVTGFSKTGYQIVKHRVSFTRNQQEASMLYAKNTQLEDLEPRDIFSKKIKSQELDPEIEQEIMEAFNILLEIAHTNIPQV